MDFHLIATFLSKLDFNMISKDLQILYIGNRPQKKKFANFTNLEVFVNVFLHFLISAEIFIYDIA